MSVIINKTKLIPSKVGLVQSKLAQGMKFNNYFYEFTKNSNEYPLELAIKQIKQIENFDIVILINDKNTGYYFVFNKTPLRKTIFVENHSFLQQLIKMKELFENIIILNDTKLSDEELYKNNPEIFENVTFLGLEKLPSDLIDIRKRNALIKKYIAISFIFVISIISLAIFETTLNGSLNVAKSELNKKNIMFNALNKKEVEVKSVVELPSKEKQVQELNDIFKKIDEGKL